jgi:hypothetical protein
VLVVLGCWALLSLSRRVQHMGARRAAAVVVAPVMPGSPASPRPAAATAAMRAEFENAARYADFIAQAMRRPAEGGEFYALLAWKRCDAVKARGGATAGAGSEDFRGEALALVEDLVKRCAGVQAGWPTIDALYATAPRGGRDALLPEDGRGIVTPARRETAEQDVDAALRSADRRAAAEVLRADAAVLDVGNSTGDPGVDSQLREKAAGIVACELAGDCRRGLDVSLHCVDSGDCAHDDWRDIVLAQVPESQRIIFDTMLAGLRARAALAPGP